MAAIWALSLSGCSGKRDPILTEWKAIAPQLAPIELEGEELIDISDLVAIERSDSSLPALGGGMVVGDRIIAIGVDGNRKANGSAPVSLTDSWHIGSITKSITSTLTAALIEEGLLSWETTVTEVFSEETVHTDWQNVRTLDLARHLGGASEPNLAALLKGRASEQPADQERRDWLFQDVLTEAPRNRDYHYSNGNYILLGAMLEELSGRPWQELVREYIYEPLGLESAGFGPPQGDQPLQERIIRLSLDNI